MIDIFQRQNNLQLRSPEIPVMYRVKIINPNKKSEAVVRDMRSFRGRFSSVTDMKVRIMDEFKEQVPQSTSFSIGYFEGRQSTRYWIYSQEDLHAMYSRCSHEIMLWCDGPSEPSAKRAKTSECGHGTKREEKEAKVEELAKELKERNDEKLQLNEAQYRLWARMIITGVHCDKDTPPQIPVITGVIPKRKEKSSLQETIINTAATAAAFVKAVNSGSVCDNSTLVQSPTVQTIEAESPRVRSGHTLTMSPIRMAEVRGKSFEQLSTLKRLFDEDVLTLNEFEEQKAAILSGLKRLRE